MECPICYSEFESGIVKPACSHLLCLNCYSTLLLNNKRSTCPLCRKILFKWTFTVNFCGIVILRIKI